MTESEAEADGSYPAIEDYAIVGDCRSAALVSRQGSLDWLCLPRFDSPSLFGALLDRRGGGRFAVRPRGRFETSRRYLPDTNVLETTFRTDEGRLRLLDLMPVSSEEDKRRRLRPAHEVLRRVECLEGEVEVEVLCDPRPEYGAVTPRLRSRGALGHWYEHDGVALALRSEVPLQTSGGPGIRGAETLRAGERRDMSLVFAHGEPAVLPTFGAEATRKIEDTERWWREWAQGCRYEGPHRDAVIRSALTLKLMTYAPSGAVVAAPTTSLPEKVGGVRNWDYRYCWLRDASLTLQAFMDLDRQEEADAFLAWILHSTRLTRPELQVLYDVHGETHVTERELDHLDGYRGSRPVRVGNGARGQLQMDVYGEVADAALEYVHRGGSLRKAAEDLLVGFGEVVSERWEEPDEGIWELRSGRRHHTYSKVMCWVTLDRLLKLDREGHLSAPTERFARERERIRDAVEERGFNQELASYVDTFGGDRVDASLLLLSRYGYVDADSERMISTCSRIHEELGEGPLLYRYRDHDGLPSGEGAFGIAGFWWVECQCRQGRVEEATRVFEELCGMSNDVGLFSEELDPESRAFLGNFPQAFTHIGLVDAALTLAESTGHRKERRLHRAASTGSPPAQRVG